MKSVYLVDANLVLRFLLGDHPDHSPKATAIFSRAEAGEFLLELTPVTVAEIVWLLLSFHKMPRGQVADRLLALLENPGITAANKTMLINGLRRLQTTTIDVADCMLAAESVLSGKGVLSFDRDFKKFPDVSWHRPDAL